MLSGFFLLAFIYGARADSFGQKYADELAKYTSKAIYNLDQDQLIGILEGYLVDRPAIQALIVTENIDNERLLSFYRQNNQMVFNQPLPDHVANLDIYTALSYYEDEEIGRVDIFYEEITQSHMSEDVKSGNAELSKSNDELIEEPILNLSRDELVWLGKNPKIRVHNELNWPPFDFNVNGQPTGFSVEYMKLLARKIGIEVEFISGPSWNDFLEMMKTGALDVMLNIVQTPNRDEYINFTDSYINNPAVIVVRSEEVVTSLEELEGKILCIPEGYFYQELLEKNYPNIPLMLVAEQSQCLEQVSIGRAYATLGGVAVQDYIIRDLFLSNLKIASSIHDPNFSNVLRLGVRKELKELQSILQKAMKVVSEKELRVIRQRWISTSQGIGENDKKDQSDFDLIYLMFSLIAGFAATLIIIRIIVLRLARGNSVQIRQLYEIKGASLFMVGIFLSIVISAAWVTSSITEQSVREDNGQRLQTVLGTTHEAILSWVKSETRYINRIAANPELLPLVEDLLKIPRKQDRLVESKQLSKLRQWFREHTSGNETQGFFIIAPDNISIGSKRDENIGIENLISQKRPKQLRRVFGGVTQFIPPLASDIVVNLETSRASVVEPTMFFAAPVKNKQGKVIAILALRYDPTKDFTRITRLGRLGETGEAYFFDRDAVMLSDSRYDPTLRKLGLLSENQNAILNLKLYDPGGDLTKGYPLAKDLTKLPLNHLAKSILENDVGLNIDGYRDYRGVSVLGAWLWDNQLDIGLVAEIDEAEALSNFYDQRFHMGMLLGLTVLFALLLTGFLVWVGDNANRSLRKAKDDLEEEVIARTRELNFQKFALDKHAIVSSTDADGNILYVNDRFIEITGYAEEELIGKNHRILRSGHHDAAFYQDMWRVISNGDVWHGELCNQNKDGGLIWLAASIIPFTNSDGIIERYISIRTDITKRKKAEKEIRISENRMRAIIDNAVDGIIVINPLGVIQSFSPAAERMFGYREHEVKGENIKILMPHQYAQEHDGYLTRYLNGGKARIVGTNREVVGRHKDGTEFAMDLAIGETKVDGQHFFTGIVRDISDRKKAEIALRQKQTQLQEIMRTVRQGVVLFDENKSLVSWNDKYPNILNLEKDFLYEGLPIYDLALHLAKRGEYGTAQTAKELAKSRVEALWLGETRRDLSFGDGRSYDAHSVPTKDGQLVITYTDITERKRTEEIIASSMKLIQESISYASRIQKSVLPSTAQLNAVSQDHFLIWEPKDIVGGDLCLMRETKNGPLLWLIDCTGHGVPGAFMTMIVTGAIDQALSENSDGQPAAILSRVNQLVKIVLNQVEGQDSESDDGFECGVCLVDHMAHQLVFAGARFELWYGPEKAEEFKVIKGDKVSIGYRSTSVEYQFTNYHVPLHENFQFYMSTDGMIDQIGGPRNRSFGKRRLKKVLLDHQHLPMEDQEKQLLNIFNQYGESQERRDDVSVLGVKL